MVFNYYFIDGKNNKVYEDEDCSALIRAIKDRIDDDVITAMGEDFYDDRDVEDNLDSLYDYFKDPILYDRNPVEQYEKTYTAEYPYTFGVELLEDDEDEDEYRVYTYDDYMRDVYDINHMNLDHDDDIW